ncbi:Proteasome subunit beta type-3 [Venturia nashicola]|uniref:Proteasome subunit beta type-3 n=1 Tax=Venturia nashicola TaxID=86259 RepID=A0A4Z1NKC2_9PEZI|nr:Proteasome subunit beta type-3 [Venturia nashicola]
MVRSFIVAGVAAIGFVVGVQAAPFFDGTRYARGGAFQIPILAQRDEVDLSSLYDAHNFSVPIDHWHNDTIYEPHSNGTFPMRYWYDATYYEPGGPVIALMAGETSGVDRLPYMQKGILAQLAQATGGLSVIVEHRYYGTSFPVPDLSIENLRFLTTDQSLADTAYFAKNIVFEDLDVDYDLTSDGSPWIVYGGSYAGAYVAFLRKLYPDVFFGAISSSGVPEAIIDYWQYWLGPLNYGPPDCMNTTQDFFEVIDGILIGENNTKLTSRLKTTFLLPNVTYDDDFANVLSEHGIGQWQGRNWDPAVGSPKFDYYCGNITNDTVLYTELEDSREELLSLTEISGYDDVDDTFITRMINFIGFLNATTNCTKAQDTCFGSHDPAHYQRFSIRTQGWRSWSYQYCTQWGYFQTGSGFPEDIQPPVSRLLDVEYLSIVCREAFNLTGPPDIDAINKYGGFDIAYDRLAFVDGAGDPWKYAGPHAPVAPNRKSTTNMPFIEIKGAVHHWDENGLFANETTKKLPPAPVVAAQAAEVSFVKAWLSEYTK